MAGECSESAQSQSGPRGDSEDSEEWNNCWIVFIFLAMALPNAFYLVLCTDLTDGGAWLVREVAPKDQSVHGDVALCTAALLATLCYVLDWNTWHRALKVVVGGVTWGLFVTGSALKGRKYPAAIRVAILLHVPLLLAFIRLRWGKENRHKSRENFYRAVAFVCWTFAVLWFIVFVLYYFPLPGSDIHSFSASHYWEDSQHDLILKIGDVYAFVLDGRPLRATDCSSDDPAAVTINGSHTDEDAEISGELKLKVLAACTQADLIMVFLWVSPLFASFVFILLCILCTSIMARVNALTDGDRPTTEVVAPIVTGITVCVGGMYVATYTTGVTVNLSNGLIALGFWGFSALAIWSPFELSNQELDNLKMLVNSNFTGPSKVRDMLDNEWVQAMLTGCGLMPALIALEKLRIRFIRFKRQGRPDSGSADPLMGTDGGDDAEGAADADDDFMEDAPQGAFVDDVMRTFMRYVRDWNWASVLVKVCILGDVYFTLQVGGTKASYVFLAGMNEYLSSQAYVYTLLIVFLIGLTMFLLPPVPGVPVYVFCGIVLGKERDDTPLGFWGSCAVAVLMGLVLKLIACACQYLLGYLAGQNIQIQKFVGVDTSNVKAIEKILKDGAIYEKIVIFVGGPDWPTSVMSGILKVHLPTMLLLTTPVFFVMAPCVLAGAYMSKVKPTSRNAESMIADGLMGAAAAGQLGSMVLATYFITKAVTSGGDDLTAERPEHHEIRVLRAKEQRYNERYRDELSNIGDFTSKTGSLWWIISAATLLNVLSNLAFTSDSAFENFAVSGKISDKLDEFGLGGNPFNIVRPVGRCALAAFGISIVLHVVFAQLVSRRVNAAMTAPPAARSAPAAA